jgi:hypothetical protein
VRTISRTAATARAALCCVLLATGPVLAGCSLSSGESAQVTAAPGATAPACTTALAAAPATVAGLARTPLPVAGTLSWGEPAVVLRCGLPAATPTTTPCLAVNGIDWTVDISGDPFVFVSYGRSPAVELRVPAHYGNDSAVAAVTDVGPVAAALPTSGRACIGAGDVSPAGSASPAASGPGVSPGAPSVSAAPSGG